MEEIAMDEMTPEEQIKQAVDAAKAKGHKVFKVAFEGTDTFYIRPVQRLEYKNLMAAIQAAAEAKQRDDLHDEKVVSIATVFPVITPEFLIQVWCWIRYGSCQRNPTHLLDSLTTWKSAKSNP